MSRYIDADKLKQHYSWWKDDDREVFDNIVDLQPTVNAIEVVRCRNCKYATYDKSIDRYDCRNWGLDGDEYTEADDFCSYGEKRTND